MILFKIIKNDDRGKEEISITYELEVNVSFRVDRQENRTGFLDEKLQFNYVCFSLMGVALSYRFSCYYTISIQFIYFSIIIIRNFTIFKMPIIPNRKKKEKHKSSSVNLNRCLLRKSP